MFNWLKKVIYNSLSKPYNQHCLVVPIISNKKDLKDGQEYRVQYKSKYLGLMWFCVLWNKNGNYFANIHRPKEIFCNFDEAKIIVSKNDFDNGLVFQYNPTKINELDLKELNDICFIEDENISSEEVWEKLIKYFDERGIYPNEK